VTKEDSGPSEPKENLRVGPIGKRDAHRFIKTFDRRAGLTSTAEEGVVSERAVASPKYL